MASGCGADRITSDKADYAPGEFVTFDWRGLAARRDGVDIYVNDDSEPFHRPVTSTCAAASDGDGQDQFNLPSRFVAVYTVMASGDDETVVYRFERTRSRRASR